MCGCGHVKCGEREMSGLFVCGECSVRACEEEQVQVGRGGAESL